MTLRIVQEKPPNYDLIVNRFSFATRPGIYFCYGNKIFVPFGDANLSPALMKHEEEYSRRQFLRPTIERWWNDYLADRDFRLAEELIAHQVELAHFDDLRRGMRKAHLRQIATRLASPLYDLGITVHKAKQLITGRQNPDL